MQIRIEKYNEHWINEFEKIKQELFILLKDFSPEIEHFGSTSVPGLAAKPVIDILVGIQDIGQFELLEKKILASKKYIYYQVFNKSMPERRLFVRLKDGVDTGAFKNIYSELAGIPHDKLNQARIAHVHVWKYGSQDWIRHIAFREYLKSHNDVKLRYEKLKKELSQIEWENGMEYNDGKDSFIKIEEKKALEWYLARTQKI